MLQLADSFFTLFHLTIIGLNLFGWIHPKTRKIHFIVVCLTLACWLILGIWYGIGYCPITDWQWQIKEKLGETNLPASFIKYFADKITGKNMDADLIDALTGAGFGVSILAALAFRIRGKTRQPREA